MDKNSISSAESGAGSFPTNARDAALAYLERNWSCIPLPPRSKDPSRSVGRKWQSLRITRDDVPAHFDGSHQNIGVLLGEPSKGLVDVDLDCPEALVLADEILSKTPAVFGRKSTPRAHRLYCCVGITRTHQFKDVDGSMLVELRSTGGQTVFPPSVHPDGEQIEWYECGEPLEVAETDLLPAVERLAAASIITRHWPAEGSREEAAMALAGMLLRAGWEVVEVVRFVGAVAHAAGDEEEEKRVAAVHTTQRRLQVGDTATGATRLATLLGDAVVKQACKWLRVGDSAWFSTSGKGALILTDTGNSERLVKRYGDDLRYCFPWKKWLAFGGKRWRIDQSGTAMSYSKHIARALYAEAAKVEAENKRDDILKWAKTSEKAERRKAMVELSQSEQGIAIAPGDLDRHPYLLNCSNGTLDLQTFELREHERSNYLIKLCPTRYVPGAACPTWLTFLERVLPDDDVRAYLQRFLGYALTGDVSEQVFLIADGDGQNGKSTLFVGIQRVLSQAYAIQISTDLLLAKDHSNHPTEIADLFGVRLAIGTECPKDKALDERLVKQLTGGEPIRARRMREDFWEFEPTHKLVLVTNHVPQISINEYAVTRRIHALRFNVRIPEAEKDKQLPNKLRAEREGILAWTVEGCRQWRERGLDPPEQVLLLPKTTTRPKRPVEVFVEQLVRRKPGARVGATALYQEFVDWCLRHGHTPASQQDFGTYLGREGFGRKKSDGVMTYLDIELVATAKPDREDQGGEGPLSPLNASGGPHEESNGRSGPSRPGSSLNGLGQARTANESCDPTHSHERTCRACGGRRFWRLRESTNSVCGRCHPPSEDLADPVWNDTEAAGASHV